MSSDHSPLDFSLWGHLKAIVYQVKIQNINQLKQRITNAITSINPYVLEHFLQQWRTLIEMCFQRSGSHVEHIIYIKVVLFIKTFIFPMYGNLWDTLTFIFIYIYI